MRAVVINRSRNQEIYVIILRRAVRSIEQRLQGMEDSIEGLAGSRRSRRKVVNT